MPYINVITNVSVDKEKSIRIKEKFGKAIETLPGKNESWLMVGIQDSAKMFFRGKEAVIAFVEVKILGKALGKDYNKMTAAVTEIMEEELQVEEVYVKYEEIEHWGYNGSNF